MKKKKKKNLTVSLPKREARQTHVMVGYRFKTGRLRSLGSTGYLDRRHLREATFRLLVQALYDVWLCNISSSASHSSLTNDCVSVLASRSLCHFSPPFITRKQPGSVVACVQHSAGADKHSLPTRWSVYVFPTSRLIFKCALPTGTECACVRAHGKPA